MINKINQVWDSISSYIAYFLAYLVLLNVTATFFGTLFALFNVNFVLLTIFLILSINAVFALVLYKYFIFEKITTFLLLLIVLAFTWFIYKDYSPVLEIAQDPSLYIFKALNLVHYGTLEKPLQALHELDRAGLINIERYYGYGKIFNGTKIINGSLYLDFFAGGSFVYALFGVLKKNWVFFGQTFIMLSNAVILFALSNKITKNSMLSSILSIGFFFSPVIVWFGRGSFSEPVALLIVFLILFLIYDDEELKGDAKKLVFLAVIFLTAFMVRSELIFVLYAGVIYFTLLDYRYGIIFSILALVFVLVSKFVYPIYFSRMLALTRYIIYMVPLLFLGSALFSKVRFLKLQKFIQRYYLHVILLLFLIGLSLLMFRDNIIPLEYYQMRDMHNQYIRTYNEVNFDRLFNVFPAFTLLLGMFSLYLFPKEENKLRFSLVLLCVLVPYLYFLVDVSNSPQLYWAVRRYYVLLGIILIGFTKFLSKLDGTASILISLVFLLLSGNQFYNSNQIPDYRGLDTSVETFTDDIPNELTNIIIYDEDINRQISPIVVFSGYDIFPYTKLHKNQNRNTILNSEKYYLILLDDTTCRDYPSAKLSQISYEKVGENYDRLPDVFYKSYTLCSINYVDILK